MRREGRAGGMVRGFGSARHPAQRGVGRTPGPPLGGVDAEKGGLVRCLRAWPPCGRAPDPDCCRPPTPPPRPGRGSEASVAAAESTTDSGEGRSCAPSARCRNRRRTPARRHGDAEGRRRSDQRDDGQAVGSTWNRPLWALATYTAPRRWPHHRPLAHLYHAWVARPEPLEGMDLGRQAAVPVTHRAPKPVPPAPRRPASGSDPDDGGGVDGRELGGRDGRHPHVGAEDGEPGGPRQAPARCARF